MRPRSVARYSSQRSAAAELPDQRSRSMNSTWRGSRTAQKHSVFSRNARLSRNGRAWLVSSTSCLSPLQSTMAIHESFIFHRYHAGEDRSKLISPGNSAPKVAAKVEPQRSNQLRPKPCPCSPTPQQPAMFFRKRTTQIRGCFRRSRSSLGSPGPAPDDDWRRGKQLSRHNALASGLPLLSLESVRSLGSSPRTIDLLP